MVDKVIQSIIAVVVGWLVFILVKWAASLITVPAELVQVIGVLIFLGVCIALYQIWAAGRRIINI